MENNNNLTRPTPPSRALKTQQQRSSADLGFIAVELAKLAVLLREPLNPDQQQLLTQELSDLPMEALLYAIDKWKRGDRSHLSEFEQASTRVGVFFPRPAELRQIANVYLRGQRIREEEERFKREREAERRHFEEHPEEYVPTAELEAKMETLNARIGVLPGVDEKAQKIAVTLEALMQLEPAKIRELADLVESRLALNVPASAALREEV